MYAVFFSPFFKSMLNAYQYGSGTARVIPTTTDLLHFSINDSTTVTFPVPTTGTQGASEPHMVYQYGEELLITDKVPFIFDLWSLHSPRVAVQRAATRSGVSAKTGRQVTSQCTVKSRSRSAAAHGTSRFTVSTFPFTFSLAKPARREPALHDS
jgi:hypothetical protein